MEAGSGFGKTSLSGQHGEVKRGKPMRRAREKQSEKENKMWWLKLPYVLVSGILAHGSIVLAGLYEIVKYYETALIFFSSLQRILMRSNLDKEISEGYFTLRTESMEQNGDQVSHIIAFEDQNDARNFSYLLESVFEDLDDFSANVVPISTKVNKPILLLTSVSVKFTYFKRIVFLRILDFTGLNAQDLISKKVRLIYLFLF